MTIAALMAQGREPASEREDSDSDTGDGRSRDALTGVRDRRFLSQFDRRRAGAALVCVQWIRRPLLSRSGFYLIDIDHFRLDPRKWRRRQPAIGGHNSGPRTGSGARTTKNVRSEALAMQTWPAAISPRHRPIRRAGRSRNTAVPLRCGRSAPRPWFSWKQEEVFLSEALTGEPIRLLPIDGRYDRRYVAAFPLARRDSRQRTIERLQASSTGNRASPHLAAFSRHAHANGMRHAP
jgi:hypothetical protein